MESGDEHEAPPLAENLLVLDNCWEMENVFFKNVALGELTVW